MKTYICMSYRGKHGDNATPEEVQANILKAVAVANDIIKQYPSIEPYVPHTCDDLQGLNDAWREGAVSTAYIMYQCLGKLELCDAILIIGDESEGMALEHEYARRHEIDIYKYPEWNEDTKRQFAADYLSKL